MSFQANRDATSGHLTDKIHHHYLRTLHGGLPDVDSVVQLRRENDDAHILTLGLLRRSQGCQLLNVYHIHIMDSNIHKRCVITTSFIQRKAVFIHRQEQPFPRREEYRRQQILVGGSFGRAISLNSYLCPLCSAEKRKVKKYGE
jgi:hypothetical protein